MVRKLFLFSKMELGEFPYSAERMDVVNEIRDFVLASAEEYWRRGLQIRIEIPPSPLIIQADPTYFRSILSNLLDNSAKYKEKIVGTAVITAEVAGSRWMMTDPESLQRLCPGCLMYFTAVTLPAKILIRAADWVWPSLQRRWNRWEVPFVQKICRRVACG